MRIEGLKTTKRSREEIIKEIKEAVETRSFKIGEKTYAPLHTTNYSREILEELEDKDKGFLIRCETLGEVLLKNGLTYQDYIKIREGTNLYHPGITCFQVLKEII